MAFEQELGRHEGQLDRLDRLGCNRSKHRHQYRCIDLAVLSDSGRLFGVRIIGTVRARPAHFNRVCCWYYFKYMRGGVAETNEKISERKKHHERPAKARRLQSRQPFIDLMSHYVKVSKPRSRILLHCAAGLRNQIQMT